MPSLVAQDELFDASRDKLKTTNGTSVPQPVQPLKHNFDDLDVRLILNYSDSEC